MTQLHQRMWFIIRVASHLDDESVEMTDMLCIEPQRTWKVGGCRNERIALRRLRGTSQQRHRATPKASRVLH